MKFIRKTFLSLLVTAGLFILTSNSAYANQSKVITYDINDAGTTRITYDINLENSDPNTYITKYTLSTGLSDAKNVEAKLENGQTLSYEIRIEDSGSNIEVSFPQPRSPQTNVRWSLSFTSADVINEVGKVKEIAVPGFIGDFDLSVILKVPNNFGNVNYYSRTPDEISDEGQKKVLKYTAQEIRESGILVSLDDTQVFDFTYKYELKNEEENTKIRATIALPPDYKNQKIYFDNFEPKPANGYRDADGNYVAEYIVEPGDGYEVLIQGKAVLTNAIDNNFAKPELDLSKYLVQDEYWDTEDAAIVTLVGELTKDISTDKEKGRAIYDYVVNNLSYNQDALSDANRGRLGAANVLIAKDNAICQEYTDLFITLARAAGLPARMLAGYTTAGIGYDLPDNTLHAWAEFYTEEDGWITVDPTWESTSEGFNFFGNVGLSHFVLSIRGIDSEDPPLVLSFVSSDDVSDNLVIKPVTANVERTNEIVVKTNFPELMRTIIKNKGTISIENNTNVVLTGINIFVESENLTLDIPQFEAGRAIFPGETQDVEVMIFSNNLFSSFKEALNFQVSGTLGENELFSSSQEVNIDMQVHGVIVYGGAGLALLLAVGIVFMITVFGKRNKTGIV